MFQELIIFLVAQPKHGLTDELMYASVKAAVVLSLPVSSNCSLGYRDYILQTDSIV